MLKTGIRAKKKRIKWDQQVLSAGKRDETPSAITGVLTTNHTLSGAMAKPTVLLQKRRFGAPPKSVV